MRASVSTRCIAPSYIRFSVPLPDSRERIAGFMTVATASAMRCFFAASWRTTNDIDAHRAILEFSERPNITPMDEDCAA